ncbi:DUF6318 family protein [Cellulosimicrobium sp. MI9406]|uniref:DUF6318 family protein n=1 Tax=Cellulosimicrobium sp. MI9406 TaxID=2931398 RepID=UPI0033AC0425
MTAGCLVAGCTGGGEPAPSPPVETSAEPSETETPEPEPTTTGPPKPERPAAMERDDAEGAAAAAAYFLGLYSDMMSSQDSAEWEEMSHAECGYCAASLDKVEWLRESGSAYEGGRITLDVDDPFKYVRDSQTGVFPLDGTLSQDALKVTAADGSEVASESTTSMAVRIEVGKSDDDWVIVEIAPLPEDGA